MSTSIEKGDKEKVGLGYFKMKFSEMKEMSMQRALEVKGAKEHILRMEKGRWVHKDPNPSK